MSKPALIIVVPCFNEEEILPQTNKRLLELLKEMTEAGKITDLSRILYVDDGSRDRTWELITTFHAESTSVCGLRLAVNSGQQNAIMAGLEQAIAMYGDATITIDADLQDDISVIPQMLEHYSQGCDIVYGVHKVREQDSFFKRNTAILFYRFMHFLGVKTIFNHSDFRFMSRQAVEQLCNYRERNLYLRGIVPLIGAKTACVYYERQARAAGKSKYPLNRMVNFAIDGITSFSIRPVRLVLSLGIMFFIISLPMLVYILYSYFSGRAASGWASLIISVWFVGGCILIGLGIVGEYIGKIYIEVKNRPRYNIDDKLIK